MSEVPSEDVRGVCFVVMGFGKKTDFETGRTLDLDKTYRNIIKPAAQDAGLKCIRADEIVHSGIIDVPMYDQLLNAEVVIADLSTSNKNAFYELGVRHALKPSTTIVIAEDGVKTFPFDVNHVVVRQYHHLGEDIGFDEVMSFRNILKDAIVTILKDKPPKRDSPIYTFINDLNPPFLGPGSQKINGASGSNEGATERGASPAVGDETPTHNAMMRQVETAESNGDFLKAKYTLETVRRLMKDANPDRPEDPTILRRLAFATYESRHPTVVEALEEASAILQTLEPRTSNDPETLGSWGAIHKRLWDATRDLSHLDEAVRGYRRGFFLRNDFYNGINLAYLLNVRSANAETRADAIADFIQAERVRKEVLSICELQLGQEQLREIDKYWLLATMTEAYLGLGRADLAEMKHREALEINVPEWRRKTPEDQLERLRSLLAKSPLKYIREDGD